MDDETVTAFFFGGGGEVAKMTNRSQNERNAHGALWIVAESQLDEGVILGSKIGTPFIFSVFAHFLVETQKPNVKPLLFLVLSSRQIWVQNENRKQSPLTTQPIQRKPT